METVDNNHLTHVLLFWQTIFFIQKIVSSPSFSFHSSTTTHEEDEHDNFDYIIQSSNARSLCSQFPGGLWWVKPRSYAWFDRFLLGTYDDSRWKQILRMRRATFSWLVSILHDEIVRQDTNYRPAVSVQLRVACTLYKLFRGGDYLELSERFGIGQSTALEIVRKTCKAIVGVLGYKIRFPVGDEMNTTIADFRRHCKLPNVCGAVDCTHIEILQPSGPAGFDYYDRKSRFSIILQAVCDSNRRFLDCFSGYPGSVHDARVWRNSGILQRAYAGEIMQDPIVALNDAAAIKPYLLGDSGYKLSPLIMTPYTGDNHTLAIVRKVFNKEQKKGRVFIEQAFGLLKGKFRILDTKLKMNPKYIPTVIHACCVLHNVLMECGDADVEHELEELEAAQNGAPVYADDPENPADAFRMEDSHEAGEVQRTLLGEFLVNAR